MGGWEVNNGGLGRCQNVVKSSGTRNVLVGSVGQMLGICNGSGT